MDKSITFNETNVLYATVFTVHAYSVGFYFTATTNKESLARMLNMEGSP